MSDDRTPIVAPDADNISAAARRLREGGLVAFPTETVYGLGADATNDEAVAAVFQAKDRPRFNPLIVHVGDLGEARAAVGFNPAAETLAEAFWPGALTMVLPRLDDRIALLVSAGLDTVAVRVPNHPAAVGPLASPGKNVATQGGAQKSPGMQERHYAPNLPLRLEAEEPKPGEGFLAFGPGAPGGTEEAMNLSPTGDLEEAAANLFAMMRALDGPPFEAIAVMPVPDRGLGRAINDRLRRGVGPADG